MLLYALTVFLSAFLLFQVQPVIAKMLLPWFGGTSAVWTTCMLFFQLALLAGYGYSHWLNRLRTRAAQAGLHSALLAASLVLLPIVPKAGWKPAGDQNPTWLLLGVLAVTVGLPYFLLSTTGPLLQAWYARSRKGATPYRLFALSNLASMLALLSYPVMVEPNLSTHAQAVLWSAGYCCFALLCAALAWSGGRWRMNIEIAAPKADPVQVPGWGLRLLWLGLASCASMLLLAVTNFLSQDVAPIPFLWIVPLSVYLLSFILCFESKRLYWRIVYLPLLPVALGFCTWMIREDNALHIAPAVTAMTGALFVCCMVCHGELASLKPHPCHLTGFYLVISAGGAVGGLFVGVVAPHVFRAYHEFPIALGACAVLAAIVLYRRGMLAARWRQAVAVVSLAAYSAFLGTIIHNYVSGYRTVARNFYGRLSVYDDSTGQDDAARHLLHGVIDHGVQPLEPAYRRMPVSYFCPGSGIGIAVRSLPERLPHKIGVLGLGCGTLAAYTMPGDILRIYEINPLVVQIAREQFTYLKDTAARTDIILGDGRLSLEREPSQQFDLLVMDAFSGDSVPVHLVTREAFQTYFGHMKPGGILAVNITNRYLDLRPVIERAASAFGRIAMEFDYESDDEFLCYGSSWALVMDPATRNRIRQRDDGEVLKAHANFPMWTDDFSNMQRILK